MPHDYRDWDTGAAIRQHYLSTTIVNGHSVSEGNYVFDEPSLAVLQRFVAAPEPAVRDAILAEHGFRDAHQAATTGSLTCFIIGRHGSDDPALDDRDLEILREWFADGMPTGCHVER